MYLRFVLWLVSKQSAAQLFNLARTATWYLLEWNSKHFFFLRMKMNEFLFISCLSSCPDHIASFLWEHLHMIFTYI